MLDKVLDKVKEIICIEKIDNTKILVDTDNRFPDDIALKNVVILNTYLTTFFKYFLVLIHA